MRARRMGILGGLLLALLGLMVLGYGVARAGGFKGGDIVTWEDADGPRVAVDIAADEWTQLAKTHKEEEGNPENDDEKVANVAANTTPSGGNGERVVSVLARFTWRLEDFPFMHYFLWADTWNNLFNKAGFSPWDLYARTPKVERIAKGNRGASPAPPDGELPPGWAHLRTETDAVYYNGQQEVLKRVGNRIDIRYSSRSGIAGLRAVAVLPNGSVIDIPFRYFLPDEEQEGGGTWFWSIETTTFDPMLEWTDVEIHFPSSETFWRLADTINVQTVQPDVDGDPIITHNEADLR